MSAFNKRKHLQVERLESRSLLAYGALASFHTDSDDIVAKAVEAESQDSRIVSDADKDREKDATFLVPITIESSGSRKLGLQADTGAGTPSFRNPLPTSENAEPIATEPKTISAPVSPALPSLGELDDATAPVQQQTSNSPQLAVPSVTNQPSASTQGLDQAFAELQGNDPYNRSQVVDFPLSNSRIRMLDLATISTDDSWSGTQVGKLHDFDLRMDSSTPTGRIATADNNENVQTNRLGNPSLDLAVFAPFVVEHENLHVIARTEMIQLQTSKSRWPSPSEPIESRFKQSFLLSSDLVSEDVPSGADREISSLLESLASQQSLSSAGGAILIATGLCIARRRHKTTPFESLPTGRSQGERTN